MIASWKPYNENEYVKLGTCERLYISWYTSNKIKMNEDQRLKKELQMQTELIMHFFLYERVNQYSEQKNKNL